MDQSLLTLTADVVSDYVSNNPTPADQISALIQTVHQSLATAGPAAEAAARKQQPAIDVRKSVSSGHLTCLVCGQHFKMLKRHLRAEHDLTPGEYRSRYGLPTSYPIVAPDYAKVRSAMAKKIGLGYGSPGRPPSRMRGRKRR